VVSQQGRWSAGRTRGVALFAISLCERTTRFVRRHGNYRTSNLERTISFGDKFCEEIAAAARYAQLSPAI
jgi:hypothetical protein